VHPRTHARVAIAAPMPDDLGAVLAALALPVSVEVALDEAARKVHP
jgi:hypothetical protein